MGIIYNLFKKIKKKELDSNKEIDNSVLIAEYLYRAIERHQTDNNKDKGKR